MISRAQTKGLLLSKLCDDVTGTSNTIPSGIAHSGTTPEAAPRPDVESLDATGKTFRPDFSSENRTATGR